MEQLYATHSVSMAEFRSSPDAVIDYTEGAVAVLRNDRPAAYVVNAQSYEAMVKQMEIDRLRREIQIGRDSGPTISAEVVFAELRARYAD